jgi:hypothetical protein
MPTQISDLWVPDVWVAGMQEKQATFPSIFTSGIVSPNGELQAVATGAGNSANVPFFKDITDQDDEVQVEDTAPSTDNKITASKMVCPILNRVCMNSATALSAQVSGGDPVDRMVAAMTARRLKQRQKTLLSILRGVFGSYGAAAGAGALSALRVDKFDESGNGASADQLMSVDLFIDSKALMGELSDDLRNGGMFIHPNVLAALEKADVTAFKEKSMGSYTIKTYREIPLYVSESLCRVGTTNGYVYETYLIGNGTVGYGEKAQLGDVIDVASLQLETVKGKNNEIIYDRTRFVLHPNGMKWKGTPAGQSATNAELATVGNWENTFASANRCGMVCIRTNG